MKTLSSTKLPFPPKTLLPVKSKSGIQSRKESLQLFLTKLTEELVFMTSSTFLKFIRAKKYCPRICSKVLDYKGKITHNKYGFRDFMFLKKARVLVSLTNQESAASRFDTYMNKFSLAAIKKSPALSSLEIWSKNNESDNPFHYIRSWAIDFKIQAISLWVSSTSIAVGMDDGAVFWKDVDFGQEPLGEIS